MTSRVERLWPGATVVCLGTGPSLTMDDVAWCRGQARVIAVNNAVALAPWADALYACDAKWWRWHQSVPDFAGLRYSLAPDDPAKRGCVVLNRHGHTGLSLDPSGLCTGSNSGYQAINLAVHLGATRIILLGYDMRGGHFFGAHPDSTGPAFAKCLDAFKTLAQPLKDAGVSIVNCTPKSALISFPMASVRDTLSMVAA